MLPFSKRKATNDEVELDDDDLIVVEAPSSVRASSPASVPALAARVRPRATHSLPPGSRRILEEHVEEDVADQCLASIAAEAFKESHSQIRAVAKRPEPQPQRRLSTIAPPPLPATPSSPSSSRLPIVSSPPFLRTTTVPLWARSEVPGMRDSSPPPAFARRSTPGPMSAVPLPGRPSLLSESERAGNSVMPVTTSTTSTTSERPAEPTIILVRERPRSAWIFAAAAFGAFGALIATRWFGPSAAEPAVTSVSAAQAPMAAPIAAPPSTVVVAPAAPAAPVAPRAASIAPPIAAPVVSFREDQGIAIAAPVAPRSFGASRAGASRPLAPAASPTAARPAAHGSRPSIGPALPDGSFGLTATPAQTATVAAPVAPVAPAPPAAPKRPLAPLTPEQQLAEAQLKASMK